MNNDNYDANKENSTPKIENSLQNARDDYFASFQTPTGPHQAKIARTQSEILLPRRIFPSADNLQGIIFRKILKNLSNKFK